ncbi:MULTISPECIES: chemotaxis protein CheW [Aeromonas]|uniref:chemotaxis protein CheW n=2 Tax=Aeromonadaceae TaxID=84642 RepID=UPI001E436DF2|nr:MULTISPECIES: chemotaxis protein CheW [Aeromonas]
MMANSATTELVQSDVFHCVTFMLGGECYGIDITHMREIIEYEGMTAVPMMPTFVRGIINLRGAVVPVIDLQVRFGQGMTALQSTTGIAILSLPTSLDFYQEVGVLLDAVCDVLELRRDAIEPPPHFGVALRSDFIAGIVTVNDQFVVLLDVTRALSFAELSALVESKMASHHLEFKGSE